MGLYSGATRSSQRVPEPFALCHFLSARPARPTSRGPLRPLVGNPPPFRPAGGPRKRDPQRCNGGAARSTRPVMRHALIENGGRPLFGLASATFLPKKVGEFFDAEIRFRVLLFHD